MLFIFGGLPGTGKSTLSATLAQELPATYLRVDVVEQALRRAGVWGDGSAGYVVCYELASENLRLGLSVIADTVNPIRETRQTWREVAQALDVPFVEIEVVCTNAAEHKHRIESRAADIPGLVLPTWQQVMNRRYDEWDTEHIVIDTAYQSVPHSYNALRERLAVYV